MSDGWSHHGDCYCELHCAKCGHTVLSGNPPDWPGGLCSECFLGPYDGRPVTPEQEANRKRVTKEGVVLP